MASLYFSERSFAYESCLSNLLCVDVHKSFLVATIIKPLPEFSLLIRRNASPPSTIPFLSLSNGCWITPVVMSVWNLPVNIGFLCSTFWKTKLNVTIANPKWVKAVKGNKMIPRIPNGLGICSEWGLCGKLYTVQTNPYPQGVYEIPV